MILNDTLEKSSILTKDVREIIEVYFSVRY